MATRINFPVPTNLGNLYDPVLAQDGATKNWVEGLQQLETSKNYCAWGTTADIILSGLDTQAGGEWTATLNAGDRIFVKAQINAAQNGIYVASATAWTRALDANTWAKIVSANLFVNQGLTLNNTGWVANVAPVGTLETTPINFIQFTANAGNFWPIGYSTISATNAKLGASNRQTIIGGNNTDCIVLGDSTTESVSNVTGIPTTTPLNTQNNAGGIGVSAGNVYVAIGTSARNGVIYTGSIASPSLSAWSQSLVATNNNSFFVKINGDSTYVTTTYGVGGNYTVKVGNISTNTNSVSANNGCFFTNASGAGVQIEDISFVNTGTNNNYLHVIADTLTSSTFFAEYGISTANNEVTLTSSAPAKIAPNPGAEFWLDCAFSANRVSYAIDTSGSLYAVDFSFTTPTVTLAVSEFINVNGPRATYLNANANYVVAIGADNNISLYNVSNKVVTTFAAIPLITYPFGVAVDTTGVITVVGANASGTTIYISQPSLQVIAQFLVPARPYQLFDVTGAPLGNNQLFVNTNTGLQKIIDGTSAGQTLTFRGSGNLPTWSGGLREWRANTVQNLQSGSDTVVLYDTVVTTVGDVGLTLASGIFTNNTGAQLILNVSYQVAFALSSNGSRVAYIGIGTFPTTNRRGMLDLPASTDFTILSSSAKIVLAAGGTFHIAAWQNSVSQLGINGAYAAMSSGQSSFIQIERILS